MKRKSSARDEVAQTPVTPTRQKLVLGRVVPLVQQSTGRVAPLAHSAVGIMAPLTANAAERINAATVLVTPYATSAAGRITPVAVTAAGRVVPLAQSAADHVRPLAAQAIEHVTPYTHQAVDLVTPYAQQAAHLASPYVEKVAQLAAANAEKVGPLATAAKARGAQAAHGAVEALTPRLDGARERVSPAVEAARGKVTDAVAAAATAPVLVEATKRGKATLAAARGELTVPEPVVESSSWVKRLAVLLALAGVAALVVRKLLGSKDADWQAARPSTPYVPSAPAAAPPVNSTVVDNGLSVSETEAAASDLPVDAVEAAPQSPLSSEELADAPSVSEEQTSLNAAYVGSEPPEGYVIKGNENSMKYHTPESSGYSDTIAEVWFSSEQAAADAGFVRARG